MKFELLKDNMKQKRICFDAQIKQTLEEGSKSDNSMRDPDVEMPLMPPYGNEQGDEPQMLNTEAFDVDAYNQYVGADVKLPWGDSMANAQVTGQKWE